METQNTDNAIGGEG